MVSHLKKKKRIKSNNTRSRRYPAETMINADDSVLLTNTPA